MTDTVARLRSGKIIFETMVDLELAMKFKRGEKINVNDMIRDKFVYTDIKKGMKAGKAELENVFGTTDFFKIVEEIVRKGDIEIKQEFRDEILEKRKKQIIEFLNKNAVDIRTGRPFTYDILSNALKQAKIKIENQPVEKQINDILEKLKSVLPIKIETKKIKLKVPAEYTGRVYGLIQDYKEKEEWLSDGSLEIILNIPVGIQMDFYDKINSITHGAIISQEIK